MTDERAFAQVLHEALDRQDVSGPFQRLQIELEKPGAAHTRRGRRIFMTRNRLVLLAAALVLFICVSVFVSARMVSDLNHVGQTINSGPDKAEVAQLLARPLHLQHLSHINSSADCPDGPFTHGNYGLGPVYGNGSAQYDTTWGTYWDVMLIIDKGTKGPIVFRGEDVVLGWPLVFLSSSYGVGRIYGTDTLGGATATQYSALGFDPSQGRPYGGPPTGTWVSFRQGFKHFWSGCVGFQVDGPDFSETFYSAGAGT